MLIISIAVFTYTYSGIIYSKFNVSEYNNACIKEGFIKSDTEARWDSKKKRISEAASSVIMLTSTAVFLLFGFLKNLWHPAWVVFPIGAILCGICSVIFEVVFRDD